MEFTENVLKMTIIGSNDENLKENDSMLPTTIYMHLRNWN